MIWLGMSAMGQVEGAVAQVPWTFHPNIRLLYKQMFIEYIFINKGYWLKEMSQLGLLPNNLVFSYNLGSFWAIIIDSYTRNFWQLEA